MYDIVENTHIHANTNLLRVVFFSQRFATKLQQYGTATAVVQTFVAWCWVSLQPVSFTALVVAHAVVGWQHACFGQWTVQ